MKSDASFRYIFTVTTGRSGTAFLASMLSLLRRTVSLHEPDPSFSTVFRRAQSCAGLARDFMEREKLPSIRHRLRGHHVYIETSHVFCKGFLEPTLELLPAESVGLILLDREHRSVASSLQALNTVPGRTEKGMAWYLSPSDPTCLTRVDRWKELNDYQLCYWYCLEIEARKEYYSRLIQKLGGRYYRTNIELLQSFAGLMSLQDSLELPGISALGTLKYFRLRRTKLNTKSGRKLSLPQRGDLDEQEADVRSRTKFATDLSSQRSPQAAEG